MTPSPAAIWTQALAMLERQVAHEGAERQAQFARLRQWLQGCGERHAAVLLGLAPPTPHGPQDAIALADALVRHLAGVSSTASAKAIHPTSAVYQEAQRWLLWLHQLRQIALRHAERAGVALSVASTPLLLPARPPASPYAPDSEAAAARTQRWRDAFIERLAQLDPTGEDPKDPKDPKDRKNHKDLEQQHWWAAVLLSSVWFGALLHPAAVYQWLRHVRAGNLAESASGDPYVVLHHGGVAGLQRRIWLVDPVSRLLLRRPQALRGAPRKPGQLLEVARRWLGCPDLPTQLQTLIADARAWWARHACPIAVGVATFELHNHDLHPSAWRSLMHAPDPGVPRGAAGRFDGALGADASDGSAITVHAPSASPSDDDTLGDTIAALRAQHPWLGFVLTALRRWPGPDHLSWLDEAQTIAPEQAQVVVSWLRAELGRSRHNATPWRVGVCDVLVALVASAGDDIEAALGSVESVEDVWAIASEQRRASVQDRQQAALALASLLRHARQTAVLQAWQSQRAAQAELLSVDTHAVTLGEYHAALEYLQPDWPLRQASAAIREMTCLLLILTYRCGLRRRETLGLRLRDVTRDGHLLIRAHTQRRLKTPAAQRIVPAALLLLPQERQRLHEWLDARRRAGASDDDRVFAAGIGEEPVSEERLAERVIEALRAVRGGRATLHQLRHAFASWTYLGLFAAQYPELLAFFDHDPVQRAELERIAALSPQLLGATPRTTRAIGYAVARLLGHISPAISLQHYVHTQALVHGAITLWAAQHVPATTLGRLAGLNKSQAYERLRGGVLGLVSPTPRPRVSVPAASAAAAAVTTAPQAGPVQGPRPALADVLVALQTPSEPPKGIDENLAQRLRIALSTFDPGTFEHCFGFALGSKALPLPQRHEERALMQRLEQALVAAHRHHPRRIREGIAVHFAQYEPRNRAVVFRGREDLEKWRTYVRFLNGLPIADWASHARLVVYRADGELPEWLEEEGLGGKTQWGWIRDLPRKCIEASRWDEPWLRRWVGWQFTAKPGGRNRAQAVLLTWLLWEIVCRVFDDGGGASGSAPPLDRAPAPAPGAAPAAPPPPPAPHGATPPSSAHAGP